MAEKAKHAFGALERIDDAISAGTLDAYDILFVKDTNGKPYVGWIDKEGNKVVVDNSEELAELESQLANQIATKVDSAEVDTKIDKAVESTVATANAYTDGKIEAAVNGHLVKQYDIAYKPDGTLVDYRDKEIRVMCPSDTNWDFQSSGKGADPNKYYIGFKAYAPNNAVSFKEDLAEIISDTTMYYFEGNDFAGIEDGKKYSIVWLPVAKYENDVWTYYGANSSKQKYIGWHYSVEWYDVNKRIIATDCIRINLSNEECHSLIEPYYMVEVMKDINEKIDEKIADVESVYEIIEF